ncbi:uncharacterized protein LOC116517881 [Thamnophis elegans]|uniref:uncharacterized protein LOC116517881 n=1 Tax=Thamnophis elegans TaxID=35005 RepID=UPI001376BA1C|nr:uncharacterized protein LOC116517881 [Thamnophis elegans]
MADWPHPELARSDSLPVSSLPYASAQLPPSAYTQCPAARINASEVCEDIERIDVKISANLTHLVCDNLQNLSHVNSTFIIQALEFTLRKKYDLPPNIVRVLLNQVNGEELINALEKFNEKIVNSSLISNQAKTAILRALWDEKLRNEDRFNETAFVTSWFQKRLRLFISGISPEMLQCLHNETMQCEQYQAMYVMGLLIFCSVVTVQLFPGLHNTC